MHKAQQQVQSFHRDVLKQPHSPAVPELRMPDLRAMLILEEAIETATALVGVSRAQSITQAMLHKVLQDRVRSRKTGPDLVEAIDGCCDTLVVTYGTLEAIGVDGEPFFDEVMRSNMAKAGGPIDENGKQLKPPGWTPPDIAGVLARISADLLARCLPIVGSATPKATCVRCGGDFLDPAHTIPCNNRNARR